MKFGIYYAYWEHEWKADYIPYIKKAAKLGFDCLEIACTPLMSYSKERLLTLRKAAADNGIFLTAGHGPSAEQDLASADPAVEKNAKAFFTELLKRLEIMDIHIIGGGIYSYWPVDFSKTIDKPGDWARAVKNVREIGKVAGDCGVDYCLEVLNRFEGYLLNTAAEGCKFVREVGVPAVKVMLDTFHANIEESDIGGAIRSTRGLLGHFHTGECNRMCPGFGRMPWREIANALHDIGYDGNVVMEPFVRPGGRVGQDIKIWRNLLDDSSDTRLDEDARKSVEFERIVFGS